MADGQVCRLMIATPLLEAAVGSFIAEAGEVAPQAPARAAALTLLILDEMARPEAPPLRLTLPKDDTLLGFCRHLLRHPEDRRDIDACARRAA